MPWTIYRYIAKDMIKLLVTSSAVLVLVISFAAAIKPLSEGLLGAGALLRYVLALAPTMVGFVLPFSAAFASTLVFSRMVNDNEMLVCRAGGISYRTILLPVIFLGLLLTLVLFYLGNWVVPSFYRRAAHMLEKDVMQLIVSQVQQKRPVKLGDMVLYADAVDDSQPPPSISGDRVQPTKLIRLRGVAVGRLGETGRLRSDSTAQKADVLLYRVNDRTWATMSLENVVFYDSLRGDLFHTQQWVLPQVLLPSPLKDDPRFLTWPQMRELGNRPERYDQIRDAKGQLAQAIAAEMLVRQISQLVRDAPPGQRGVRLLGFQKGEEYVLLAPGPQQLASGGGWLKFTAHEVAPVRVEYRRDDQVTRRIEAQQAILTIEPGDPQPEPWIRVELVGARVVDLRDQRRGTEHSSVTLPRARWPAPVLERLIGFESGRLLELAYRDFARVAPVVEAASLLRSHIVRLLRRVVAQLNERAALAVACLLMVLLGALLTIQFSGGTPLVTYFWSFLLATVVVIISHSGENLAAHPDFTRSVGLAVIWSGDLLLLVVVCGSYLRLAKH